MSPAPQLDAALVGAGPNGLAAAITLAREGRRVVLFEARPAAGGGCRSAELTLPGFVHDVCSAIHPMAAASPFFRSLPLGRHGLSLVHPLAPVAHALDGGEAVLLERSVEATAARLGPDGAAYARLMAPLARRAAALLPELLGPLHPPRHPHARAPIRRATQLTPATNAPPPNKGERARALLAGLSAHSCLSLETPGSGAFGLVLGLCAHAYGWPAVRGGSQRLTDALVDHLGSLGGELRLASPVRSLDELPSTRAVLVDVTPRQLLDLAGDRLPDRYRRRLARYRYGPGVFKLDCALDRPIPWAAPECARAGTVHLGGTLEEVVSAEAEVAAGRHPQRPFVLVAQQSRFDRSRAPEGRHTAWMYCHVPNGSSEDMTERIESQIERFAPGFRASVLARHVITPAELERYNANCIGGDINGGAQDLGQLWTRPAPRLSPYTTPDRRLLICSSSTPPGGGVHGMCGYHAARAALSRRL